MESRGRTQNWTYDGIYWLTNETINLDPLGKNGSVGYGLDPVGNRQSTTSTLPGITSSTVSFNPDDWMSIESYDANGNTISTGGRTFAYDSENRLTSMNSGAVSIVYDGFGNRVAETAGGVTTKYLVEDDVNPTHLPQVMEEIVGGVVQREYTYGLQRISENQVVSGAWTPSFYGYDGMGSVRQLTNAAGAVTDTYNYDGFGNLLGSTGSTPNNYLYRGEQYDPSLNLYYLRARYYNPLTDRFMSRDSLSGQTYLPITSHKYLYAGGNPIKYIDPKGKEAYVEEGERISASEFLSKFIGAIGCGTSFGFYAAEAVTDINVLKQDLTDNGASTASVAIGCVATLVPLDGAASLAVDIVGGVGCVAGIHQAQVALNKAVADLAASNTDAYSIDLAAFEEDWINSLLGCGLTGLGTVNDVAGYYD